MASKPASYSLPEDLPDLPMGWTYKPLAELVEQDRGICYGIVQPGSPTDDGVPVVRVNNIRNGRIAADDVLRVSRGIEAKYVRSRLKGGEVLLSLVGSLGETAIVASELAGWNVARAVGVIPVTRDANPRWIELCLRSSLLQHYIRNWATTTVQATFNLGDVARLPIPMPPPAERDAIADIFVALDDKIELNRQMNCTLESIARAIFKSWFIDFDPTRAKSQDRPADALSPTLAALFPGSFEPSALGEIPKGWTTGTINDIAGINEWALGKRDTLHTIDYVEISQVMRGDVAIVTRYARGEEPGRARRRPKHGDVALSTVRPDRGSYLLLLDPPETLVLSTGFAVLTAKNGNWAFVYVATTRDEFGKELGHLADGGAYPAIRPEAIGARTLPLPDDPRLLAAFESLVQPLLKRVDENRLESRTLAALRDALLPKLISGELRVSEAERVVGRIGS